jgi:tetratricopeptide (TPR) repeat protein
VILMNRKDRRAMRSSARAVPARPAADPTALVRLADLLMREGKRDEAREALERVLRHAPDLAAAHAGFGALALHQADGAAAAEAYLRAIERAPAELPFHYGLCAGLALQGRFAEVIAHMTQVLAFQPDYADGLCMLANAWIGAGSPQQALDPARKAFALADSPLARSLLATCLRNLPAVPDDPAMRAILVRAIGDPWDRPILLARHIIRLLHADLAALLDPPSSIPLAPLCASPLLRALLENTLAGDVALERLLTAARASLLRAAGDAWPADQLAFCCALARQCFLNE